MRQELTMKKQVPTIDEDPQMNPPDPCADTVQTQKTHPKPAIEGGPIYRTDIPKDLPPDIPLK